SGSPLQPAVHACEAGSQNWPIPQMSLAGRQPTQWPVAVSQNAPLGLPAQSVSPVQGLGAPPPVPLVALVPVAPPALPPAVPVLVLPLLVGWPPVLCAPVPL